MPPVTSGGEASLCGVGGASWWGILVRRRRGFLVGRRSSATFSPGSTFSHLLSPSLTFSPGSTTNEMPCSTSRRRSVTRGGKGVLVGHRRGVLVDLQHRPTQVGRVREVHVHKLDATVEARRADLRREDGAYLSPEGGGASWWGVEGASWWGVGEASWWKSSSRRRRVRGR